MKILPSQTALPAAIERRHTPTPVTYTRHRECLRWDFGFTCAFCLLHETDIMEGGAARWGVMSIEHINPQSTSEADINIYENCIYCCRRCNRSRSDQPRESAGRTLLEPTNASWADHFRAVGDNLIPLTDDARHTSEIYDINSPDKVARRRKRRETIEDHLTLLKQAPSRESRFLALAANVVESDPKLYAVLMDAAQKLRQQMIRARIDLARYSAIPVDASDTCRCRPKIELRLPESLEAQLIDISGFGSVVVTS